MALDKARVQLLDDQTGEVVKEVDILTSADATSYVNDNALSEDVGAFKKGQTFREEDEVTVQEVLDNLLFTDQNPSVTTFRVGNIYAVDEDATEYIEKQTTADQLDVFANINMGFATDIDISLVVTKLNSGENITKSIHVAQSAGTVYTFMDTIDSITEDSSVIIRVTSGGSEPIESKKITYKFTYPVFVGFCDISQFVNEEGFVDSNNEDAQIYFNTLIRNTNPYLSKKVGAISDLKGRIITDPLYNTKSMNPCLLIPASWGAPLSIIDANGNDISGSYKYTDLLLAPTIEIAKTSYILCYYPNEVNVQQPSLADIVYNYTNPKETGIQNNSNGTPLVTGFDILTNIPLDMRTIVDEYSQLALISHPYEGLVTYVKAEHTFFKYVVNEEGEGEWEPTNQSVHLSVTGEDPNIELGGWNDICIDIKSGKFYQKTRNDRWVLIGLLPGVNADTKISALENNIEDLKKQNLYYEWNVNELGDFRTSLMLDQFINLFKAEPKPGAICRVYKDNNYGYGFSIVSDIYMLGEFYENSSSNIYWKKLALDDSVPKTAKVDRSYRGIISSQTVSIQFSSCTGTMPRYIDHYSPNSISTSYRVSTLNIATPAALSSTYWFEAYLSFISNSSITYNLSGPTKSKFYHIGDDCDGGIFTPQPLTGYHIHYIWTGLKVIATVTKFPI